MGSLRKMVWGMSVTAFYWELPLNGRGEIKQKKYNYILQKSV